MTVSLVLLTKIALVFLVIVKFGGCFYNAALFATEFLGLGVKVTLFKEVYSVHSL